MSGASAADLNLAALARRFDRPEIAAITLMGSYARGEAGPYSDVDLVRFVAADARPPDDGSHWVDGRLVVVSTHTPESVARLFSDPETVCQNLLGLRAAHPLIDRGGHFAAIQRQAEAFRWDAAMQARANQVAAEMLVGWIEEAHKGMEGLRRNDPGRLLNALYGLSWGLTRVMMVQHGILVASDNESWAGVNRSVGEATAWVRLRRQVFGLELVAEELPPLHAQVRAGLALYAETVAMMRDDLPEPERELILATCARIAEFLEDGEHGRA